MDSQQLADRKRVAVDQAMGAAFDALKFYLQKVRGEVNQTETTTRAIQDSIVDLTIMLNSLDIEDTIEALKRKQLFDSYDRYKQKEVIMERKENVSYFNGAFDQGAAKRGALSIAKIAGVLALLAVPQIGEKVGAFFDGFFSQFTEITEDIKKLKKIVMAIGATLAAYWTYKRILDIANALFQVVNLAVVTAAALGFIKLSEDDINIERRRLKVERDKLDKEKSRRNKARDKRRKKAKKVKDALKKARKISRLTTLLKLSGLGIVVGVAIDAAIGVSERLVDIADEDEDEDAGDAEIDVTEIIIDEVVKSASLGTLDLEKVRNYARAAVKETNDAEPIIDPEAAMILGAEGIALPDTTVNITQPTTITSPVTNTTINKTEPAQQPQTPNIIPADELSDPEAELFKSASSNKVSSTLPISKPVAGGVKVTQPGNNQYNNVSLQNNNVTHSNVRNINNNLTNNVTLASSSLNNNTNNVEIVAAAPKLNLNYPVEVNVNRNTLPTHKASLVTLAQAPTIQAPAVPTIIKTSAPTIEAVPAPKPAPAVIDQQQLIVGDLKTRSTPDNSVKGRAIRESEVSSLTNAVGDAIEKQNAADTEHQKVEADLAVLTAKAELHKNLQSAPAVFADSSDASEKNNLIAYNSVLNASIKRNQSRGMNIINIDNTKVVVYQPNETNRKITREPSIVATKIGMV